MFLQELQAFIETFDLDPSLVEIPQDRTMGDFAVPCFSLAKQWKKPPNMIAEELVIKMNEHTDETSIIQNTVATWPYINFFIKTQALSARILSKITKEWEQFGAQEKNEKTIMIESPSPNTNKPLHLGHVRNMLLGNALCNIYTFLWRNALRTDIVNDRWVHICKSMLMYQKYGNNELPDTKCDHYVGKRYVRFATELKDNPELDKEAQDMLKLREENDKKTVALRRKMRDRTLEWFAETYKTYGVEMDAVYYESDIYLDGKKVIEEWVTTWIFEKDETWAIFVDLESQWYDKKILQRSDGTAIYITQDIFLAMKRHQDHAMDKLIYVVGSEQEYHFAVLFEIFKLLWYSFAEDCFHMSYGMISLPDGKMKSREWNVVDADRLYQDMIEKVTTQMEGKEDLPDFIKTTEKIAMWAIKFFILKFDSKKAFVFDRESSLSFSGESWPYIQYTSARCASILQKWTMSTQVKYELLQEQEERQLLLHLSLFPKTVADAGRKYQPYLIARYLLDLSQLFNSFYQKHHVIVDELDLQTARLTLVWSIQTVLKTWLRLLWIESPEKM